MALSLLVELRDTQSDNHLMSLHELQPLIIYITNSCRCFMCIPLLLTSFLIVSYCLLVVSGFVLILLFVRKYVDIDLPAVVDTDVVLEVMMKFKPV